MVLKQRIAQVEERIERAAARAGRRRDQITLVAVTKRFGAETVAEAYQAGLRHFGENYVQEFASKAPALAALPEARFHFIGHLQSNKTRRAAELFHVIETVDSEKIARRINEIGKLIDVMLEVKLSPEQAKSGASPEQLPALVEAVRACPNLRLAGLMTMPPWSENPEASRPYFRRLARVGRAQRSAGAVDGHSRFRVASRKGATQSAVCTACSAPGLSIPSGFTRRCRRSHGVADYSAALLEQLPGGRARGAGRGRRVNLYHIGNNQLHRRSTRAVERPGVVVLHDAVLQHLFLGWLDRGAYVEEFVYNYGEWRRSEAAALWDGRRRSASQEQHFRYPMLKRIAETARAVVCAPTRRRHRCAARRAARVVVIPHCCRKPRRCGGS